MFRKMQKKMLYTYVLREKERPPSAKRQLKKLNKRSTECWDNETHTSWDSLELSTHSPAFWLSTICSSENSQSTYCTDEANDPSAQKLMIMILAVKWHSYRDKLRFSIIKCGMQTGIHTSSSRAGCQISTGQRQQLTHTCSRTHHHV